MCSDDGHLLCCTFTQHRGKTLDFKNARRQLRMRVAQHAIGARDTPRVRGTVIRSNSPVAI
jgi:hypothetical protein